MKEHYWKARLIRGGPWIPVRTFFSGPLLDGEEQDRSPRWQAQVRLETSGRAILFGDDTPIEIDGDMMLRNLERIEEADYRYLVDHADFATKYRPDLPDAAPKTKIDPRGKSVF